MIFKLIKRKDLESLEELLEIAVGCYVKHCDSCVGYAQEPIVMAEFWRLQNLLKEMIKESDD